jgi:hypothetical protein
MPVDAKTPERAKACARGSTVDHHVDGSTILLGEEYNGIVDRWFRSDP